MISQELNDTRCLTRRALIPQQSRDSSPTKQKEDFRNKVELSVGSLKYRQVCSRFIYHIIYSKLKL